MKINTVNLILNTDKAILEDSSKLRGYLGNEFKNYSIVHNHSLDNNFIYSYPLIQYRVINGQAAILGIEEGADTLKEISSNINELRLANSYYKVSDKIIYEKEYDVRPSEEQEYEFINPWLALNPKNYEKYIEISDWKEKKYFLNKILIGNILSMAKSLGIIVNRRLYVKSLLDSESVKYKSLNVKGFNGTFKVNFNIPDFFGLGKGVSHGFGAVKKVVEEE